MKNNIVSPGDFSGFVKGTQTFLKDLGKHNNKEWFHKNKTRYEEDLLGPAQDFVMALGGELKTLYRDINFGTQRNGSGSIMRINRDIRFSPDKRPYKENIGLVFWIGEGKKVELPCFYFHLEGDKGFFYGGQHMFPKEVLEQYRNAVDDDKKGPKIEKILESLAAEGFPLMEEPEYKRVPRGYSADHPREELLRLKGLGVSRPISWKEAASPELLTLCLHMAEKAKPLINWLKPINGL